MDWNFWRFFIIVICFLVSVINKKMIDKKDMILLRLGMFFTVLSDFCLLIINKNILGVVFFCIVQQIYNFRYTNIKRAKILLYTLTITIIILIFVKIELLIKVSIMYAICLSFSVIGGISALKNNKFPKINGKIIAIGMILFLLCDINVALLNVDIKFLDKNILFFLIWIFYLPSQFCLSISGRKFDI